MAGSVLHCCRQDTAGRRSVRRIEARVDRGTASSHTVIARPAMSRRHPDQVEEVALTPSSPALLIVTCGSGLKRELAKSRAGRKTDGNSCVSRESFWVSARYSGNALMPRDAITVWVRDERPRAVSCREASPEGLQS